MKSSNYNEQCEILDLLNSVCEFYDEMKLAENVFDNDKSVIVKYGRDSLKNIVKSSFVSSGSLYVAQFILDASSSLPQKVVAITVGSFVGFTLLQRTNNHRFSWIINRTADKVEKVDATTDKFISSIDLFDSVICNYVNNSGFDMKYFVDNNIIMDIFTNNDSYIEDMKTFCRYDFDFGYDTVSELFNSYFGVDDGVSGYLRDKYVDKDQRKRKVKSF